MKSCFPLEAIFRTVPSQGLLQAVPCLRNLLWGLVQLRSPTVRPLLHRLLFLFPALLFQTLALAVFNLPQHAAHLSCLSCRHPWEIRPLKGRGKRVCVVHWCILVPRIEPGTLQLSIMTPTGPESACPCPTALPGFHSRPLPLCIALCRYSPLLGE